MGINLANGQEIRIEKEADGTFPKLIIRLALDVVKPYKIFGIWESTPNTVWDMYCLMFNEQKILIDQVWFNQLKSVDGSVILTEDRYSSDDERFIIDLSRVPKFLKSLVFTVKCQTGEDFSQVKDATCRMVNAANNQEVARFNLTTLGKNTSLIVIKIYRYSSEWKMQAIGKIANWRTFEDLLPLITPHL